ncbi:type I glyceraldehyde-3-phosphate dehydrogenase [Spirochaeta cellobiosiphila]|uniref:type I glyceraldehyde-3-phosphate dehydrogenase n=1 Tax=Spirochaeta cellobiosiphila TaxID=504483 RepID=UPI001B7FE587|nr:type I glyceraldehyde-3-phosphate dehydrogenase [Spirochaeta cellobiosiphila]
MKIGINGFGRIGRSVLRAALKRTDLEVVAVNDLTDSATLAHLFEYDTVLGTYRGEVSSTDQALIVDGKSIHVIAEKDPALIPWSDYGVDIVLEATGFFNSKEAAAVHITKGGAKRVIITAPAKGADLTTVMGVNNDQYDPQKHLVVSNGSCTTNALAPIVKVINDKLGIENGLMLTTHAYTNSQALLDKPMNNLRGARAAAESIIPYSSGAAKAIGLVIPELDGKLTGYALRVPVPVVSALDITVTVKRDTNIEEVNKVLKEAADSDLKGIMEYNIKPLVSRDHQGNNHSTIIDSLSTTMSGPRLLKILSWYDNEWGFSNRLLDLSAYIASKGL